MPRKSNSLMPVVLLVCLVSAALFMLAVKPKRAEVADRRDELDQARQELTATQIAVAALKGSADDADLAALLVRIPLTDDAPALLNQVNTAATATGVTVTRLSFATPVASKLGSGSQVAVALAATGPRTGLDQFLSGLAALPRLTILDQANLGPIVGADAIVDPAAVATFALEVDLMMFSGAQSGATS